MPGNPHVRFDEGTEGRGFIPLPPVQLYRLWICFFTAPQEVVP